MTFIESKVQQKQMYKLCLCSDWGMGYGGWSQVQGPGPLLKHAPAGGRAMSMHHAVQAAAPSQPWPLAAAKHGGSGGEGTLNRG